MNASPGYSFDGAQGESGGPGLLLELRESPRGMSQTVGPITSSMPKKCEIFGRIHGVRGRVFTERNFMSTITFTRNLESETLHLPELRSLVGHRVEIVVRDSEPSPEFEAARSVLLKTLDEIGQRCSEPNWDGEQAEAVSSATHAIARRLLELLPSDTPLPVIAAEPDGQLNFEWYQSPRRLLTASISACGTLFWAALINSEDPRGSCQLSDRFPSTLVYWIGLVYG